MRHITTQCTFMLCMLCVLCIVTASFPDTASAPGQVGLAEVLTHRLPAPANQGTQRLETKVIEVFSGLLAEPGLPVPNVAFERVLGTLPKCSRPVLAGTLNNQLLSIAEDAGYAIDRSSTWLHFVPKQSISDPTYVMNLRIPGTVVVSRDPAKATSIADWLAANRISVSRLISGPSRATVRPWSGPDPVVLNNPSLRDYWDAFEALYNADMWSVDIEVIPSKNPGEPPITHIMTWGHDR